jgi:hypothetical protein
MQHFDGFGCWIFARIELPGKMMSDGEKCVKSPRLKIAAIGGSYPPRHPPSRDRTVSETVSKVRGGVEYLQRVPAHFTVIS